MNMNQNYKMFTSREQVLRQRKTIHTFVFIYTNRKDFRKKRQAKSLESLFII